MGRVQLQGVVVDYPGARALDGLSVEAPAGDLLTLLGPTGCGKSVALRVIAGTEPIAAGRILIDGADVTAAPPRARGVVPISRPTLRPRHRVVESVAREVRAAGASAREALLRADGALGRVGVPADALPHELSGAHLRLVPLASALARRPRVMLLDDAHGALDHGVGDLLTHLADAQRSLGITTIVATSSHDAAFAVSDRIAVMSAGRALQTGPGEEVYLHPVSPEVAAVVGSSSIAPGVAFGSVVDVWGQELPIEGRAQVGHCDVFLRPENVRLASGPGIGMTAVVETSTFGGGIRRTTVCTGDGIRVISQHPVTQTWERHREVRIDVRPVPVVVRPAC